MSLEDSHGPLEGPWHCICQSPVWTVLWRMASVDTMRNTSEECSCYALLDPSEIHSILRCLILVLPLYSSTLPLAAVPHAAPLAYSTIPLPLPLSHPTSPTCYDFCLLLSVSSSHGPPCTFHFGRIVGFPPPKSHPNLR